MKNLFENLCSANFRIIMKILWYLQKSMWVRGNGNLIINFAWPNMRTVTGVTLKSGEKLGAICCLLISKLLHFYLCAYLTV